VLSVPLGALASRLPALERAVMGVASALQTIPSLALLALMVPALGALGLRNIGFLPAFLALILYSVFPILRNTLVGLQQVDSAAVEAARAVGMSPRQQLYRVELPLALPVIVAGIRTATVWTVGAATLATPVGADSLGNYIFSGLQTRNVNAVLIGCLASAALALTLDGLGRLLLSGLQRRRRPVWVGALGAAAALYCYAGGAFAWHAVPGRSEAVTIGAKTFTEQYILSEALALQIQRVTGLPTSVHKSLGSSVAFDALSSGAIDTYVDYTGTIWTNVMKRSETKLSRAVMLQQIEAYLKARHGIYVLASLGFENTYALAMRREQSERLGIEKISDLAGVAPKLSIAGDYEFFGRPEWKSVVAAYGLSFADMHRMDAALMYQALGSKAVDVISAFSTDGRIASNDLTVLVDDKQVIPPYDALVLGSRKLVEHHPDVASTLRALGGRIQADQMRRMNSEVSEGRGSARQVAEQLVERWQHHEQGATP
jgi:osmoprotectant transport system permease protein